MTIEDVQIGLDTERRKLRYYDTDNLVKDGDLAFKISIPTAVYEEDVYFEDKEEAKKYINMCE